MELLNETHIVLLLSLNAVLFFLFLMHTGKQKEKKSEPIKIKVPKDRVTELYFLYDQHKELDTLMSKLELWNFVWDEIFDENAVAGDYTINTDAIRNPYFYIEPKQF